MKFSAIPLKLLFSIACIGVILLARPSSQAATVTWSGAGGANQSWVDTGNPNWSLNDTPVGNDVVFTTATAQANSTVNNIVNSSLTINSLTYSNSVNPINYQNTQIDSGVTLTVLGNFVAGGTTNGQRTGVNLSGAGALVVNGTTFAVGGTGASSGNGADVNMSGLANFTANLGTSGNFYVGRNSGSTTYTNTLRLAATSEITTGSLHVGSEQQYGNGNLYLGNTTNTIKANNIYIGSANAGGSARGSGVLQFNGSSGTVSIDSATLAQGGANLYVGHGNTSAAISGTVDFSGHSANLKLNLLSLGERQGPGTTSATLSFDKGTLIATSVGIANSGTFLNSGSPYSVGNTTGTLNLGSVSSNGADTSTLGSLQMAVNQQNLNVVTANLNVAGGAHSVTNNATLSTSSGTGAAGTATSIINVTGGSLSIGGNVTMATASVATGTANATLNLTGGAMSIGGDLIKGGGVGTTNATVTLNGGSLDLTGGAIGSALSTINTLNFQSGTLANVASINGTAGLTKTTAGTLTLAGTNSWAGNTVVNGGTLLLASGASLKFYLADGGVSNQITGSGNLTLAGSLVFDFTALTPVNGNSWLIVDDISLATVLYQPTFSIQGFTDLGGGLWDNQAGFQFDEATGWLAYSAIPEPSAIGLMAVGLGFLLLRRRQKIT